MKLKIATIFTVFALLICQIGVCGNTQTHTPHLYCQKKWREVQWEGLKIQVFKLRAEKFAVGKTYTLFIRNSNGSQTQVFDYIANKKGHLILNADEEVKKGAPFAITPLRKGERVSYCMKSEDRQEEIVTSVIPFPIEIVQKGVEVSLEMIDSNAEVFLCRGKGFSAFEKIELVCQSGKSKWEHQLSIDAQGNFEFPVRPAVEGKQTGSSTLTVKCHDEEFILPFVWGEQAQQFIGAICLQIH